MITSLARTATIKVFALSFIWMAAICSSLPVLAEEKGRVAYFSEFPFWESPIQPMRFELGLSKEAAAKKINIKVTYDAFDRIVNVRVLQGTAPKALGNGLGLLYVHAEQTRISYEGNREIHTFYNLLGNRTLGWGAWEMVYTKDAKGRYTSLDFFDADNNPIENSWCILRYNWEHGLDGSIVETRINASGSIVPHRPGFEFERIRLVFSPDGHLRVMQNINEDGEMLNAASGAAQYTYYYDSMGKFLRWEIHDKDGKPALGPTKTAGEYYTNHRTDFKQITFFDTEGNLTAHHSGAIHWLIKNDQYGNMIERSYWDANDQPIEGTFNFHKIIQVWDKKGMALMQKKLIDASGNPATHMDGYSSISYLYDDRGLLSEMHFLNTSGDLVVSAYEKAAIIRYDYDENGSRINIQKLDTKRNPM